MSRFLKLLILVTALLGAAGLFSLLLTNFEWVEEEVEVGYRGEARDNDYLAAQRLLQRLGRQARSLASAYLLDELPPCDGTLFLPARRSILSPAGQQRLRAWVEAGGHLIVAASGQDEETVGGASDELLPLLGVEVAELPGQLDQDAEVEDSEIGEPEATGESAPEWSVDEETGEAAGEEAAGEIDGWDMEPGEVEARDTRDGHDQANASAHGGSPEIDSGDGDDRAGDSALDEPPATHGDAGDTEEAADEPFHPPALVFALVPGVAQPLAVARSNLAWELVDRHNAAVWAIPGSQHSWLLQFALGKGRLTVLSDVAFMENAHIGAWDNARFFVHLATQSGPGETWIVFRAGVPGFLSLLFSWGFAALASGGVLLLFWLWTQVRRPGPVHPAPLPPRRRILQHVAASGQFLWRHGHAGTLLEAMRADVCRRASRWTPEWSQLSSQERTRQVAAVSGLPVQEVAAALAAEPPASRAQFTSAVRRLEKIRGAL